MRIEIRVHNESGTPERSTLPSYLIAKVTMVENLIPATRSEGKENLRLTTRLVPHTNHFLSVNYFLKQTADLPEEF